MVGSKIYSFEWASGVDHRRVLLDVDGPVCIPRGWAAAYNDVHCSGSAATVDRTRRGAFNPPF